MRYSRHAFVEDRVELTSLAEAVDTLLARTGKHLVLAAPLGLGKPHRLLNAIYRRVAADLTR